MSLKLITSFKCTFILLFIHFQTANAQGFAWLATVKKNVTSSNVIIQGVVSDNQGFQYITGTFSGSASFGNTIYTGSNEEIFIAKLDSVGNYIWVETAGGNGIDVGMDIELDGLGGLYVSGVFSGSATFDSITVTSSAQGGYGDNFLAKYDTSANIQWIKTGAQTYQNSPFYRRISASKIKIKNGFVYLLASNILFTSSNLAQRTFDSFLLPDIVFTGPGSSSVGHSFVVKTNFSGVNSWITPVYQTGGILSQSYPLDLAVKSNDNVVLQYNYYDSITIDTVPISGAGSFGIGFQYRGLLICELDTLGKYLNHYSIPNIGGNFTSLNSLGLDVDENDNTYVLSSIGVGPAFPLTIAGTNLSINGDFLLKLNDSLTPVDCSVLTNVASNTNRFTSLEVEGDEVVFGGNLNGNMQVLGANYNRVKEIIFTSIDTSLTSMNWFTSTTGSSYNIGNAIAYAQGIYDIHLSPDKSIFVSGNLGPTSRVFGSFASGVNTLEDGFLTKIVACSPVSVNISPQNGVICGVGSSLALTASVNPNLSFQWFNNGVVSTNGLTSTFVTSNAGTYSLVVDSLGCQDTSNMVSVTIENNPIVTVPPNTLNTCFTSGPIVVPSGSPLGGVWTGLGMINDSVFNPTITGAVPSILTYTYTNSSGCSGSEIRLINVVQPPVLAVSTALPESCADDLVFPLNAFVTPTGGTYSGPGVVNNSFDPALAGVGTHVIKYFYAVLQGCEDSATFNLVVNASPTISFPSLGDTCQTTFSLPLAQATPVGGVYSGPFVISNNFYPFLSGSGSFPVTYTVSENGCTSEQTQFIQVDPLPTASMTNPGDFCISDSKTILNGGMPIGGFYRLNGVLETEINPQILGPGIHVLEYVYSNSCGVAIDSNIFEVFGLPAVNLPALGDLCENASNEPLNLGTPAGGIYSGIGVLNNTFAPAIVGVGSFIISYTFTDVNGCVNADSASLVVNAAPSASASLDSSYCLNEPAFTIPSLPIGGTWSGNGVLNGTFNAGNAGVGNSSLTYIVSNAQSCSDTLIKGIQIKDIPNVTLASFAPVCNSSSGLIPLSGGLPLGGTYGGLGISNGFFNPAATGSGFHSVSYSYTDSLGCAATAVETITVDTSLVIVDFAPLGNICQNADSIILTGGTPAGGIYSGVGVSNGFFYPNLSGVGSFDLSYAYSGVNSCIAIQTALIVVDTVPVVSLNAIADLCVSDTAIVLSQGSPLGGTYSGVGVSNGFFNPGIADTGNHVITYMYSDSNGCVSEASTTVRVNGLPNVTLAALASICADSGLVNLSGGTPSGGVFSGVGVSNGQFNPTTLGGGQYSVAYTFVDSLGCSNLDTAILTVNEPVASLTAFPDICSNTTAISLTGGTPVGGVYSGLGVTGLNFDPAVSGLGPVEIYYTTSVNGCNAIDTQTIQVNPIPVLNLGTFAPICNSDTLLLNNALPLGGFYSGVGVSNGAFIASNGSIGQNSITYTVNDTNGCSNSKSQLITVNASPVLTPVTNATVQFCENLPNDTLGLFQPYGGVYTGSAIANNIFSPSNALVGNVNVTYTYSDANGCVNFANTNVTVLSAPIVNVDSVLLCDDTALVVLSGGIPLGGQYTGVGVSSGMFNPTINGVGTTNLIYTYTNLNGCLASDTSFVSVNSLPGINLGTFAPICNSDTLLLNTALPLGGLYSGVGVSNGAFIASNASIGQNSITYTVNDTNGCSNSESQLITVNALPVLTPVTNATVQFCENLPNDTLGLFQPYGGVYAGSAIVNNIFSPSNASVGNVNVTYTYSDANGCVNFANTNVTVLSAPIVNVDSVLLCDDTALVVLSGGIPLGGQYTGVGVSSGMFNPTINGLGTTNLIYTYTNLNGCLVSDTSFVSVNSLPGINLGAFAPICNSDTLLLNNALPLGGFYSGVGVSNGAFIASNASIGQNSITYTVNDTNGCSNSESQLITVNALPVLTPVTNATVQFCENLPNDTLGLFQPYGGVYTGSAIVNNIFSPSNASVGNVNVTYTYSDANGCVNFANTNVTVLSAPIVNVDSVLLCSDTSLVVLSGGTPLGGQYTGAGVSAGVFDPAINGLGTTNLIYTYTNLNGCLASDTSFVSVNSLPVISLALDSIWCINAGDINLIGGLPIGGSYSGLGVSGNSLDPTISGLGSTSISYTYTDSNTCSNAIFSVVDVKPAPVISISGDSIICNGEGTNLTSSGASSFQWSTGVAGNTVSISPSIDKDYIVIGTDSNGCNGADSILVRVNELPVIEIFGSDSLCADSTVLIEVTAGFSAYEWSSNETTSAISIGPFNEGDDPLYTVTVTDINGCEAQDSIQMIVIDCAVINGVQDSACIGSTAVIYPNPAQNQFQIKLQNWISDEIQITLISLDGRVISNQQILNSTPTQIVSFDTQTLARGVYLVRIFDEFNNCVTRLVLQ